MDIVIELKRTLEVPRDRKDLFPDVIDVNGWYFRWSINLKVACGFGGSGPFNKEHKEEGSWTPE